MSCRKNWTRDIASRFEQLRSTSIEVTPWVEKRKGKGTRIPCSRRNIRLPPSVPRINNGERRDSKSGDYAITAIATVLQSRFRHAGIYRVPRVRESSCFCAYFAAEGRGRKQEGRKGRENWGISGREKRLEYSHIRSSLAPLSPRYFRLSKFKAPFHPQAAFTPKRFIDLSRFHFPSHSFDPCLILKSERGSTSIRSLTENGVKFNGYARGLKCVELRRCSIAVDGSVADARAPASHRLGQVSDKARSRQVARKLARSSLAPPASLLAHFLTAARGKKKEGEEEEGETKKKNSSPTFFLAYLAPYIYTIYTHLRIILFDDSPGWILVVDSTERYFSRGGEEDG